MKKGSSAVHRRLLLAVGIGAVSCGSLALSSSLVACGSDDDFVPPPDAGTDAHATAPDGSTGTADAAFLDAKAPTLDGATDAATDAGPAAFTHVLVTSGSTDSTLSSYSIATGALEGTSPFPGAFGVPSNAGSAPFLLEQAASAVARLDATSPWKIDSTWNVLDTDLPTGQFPYSDPYAVVVSAGTKAYVLRYNRNVIDIIDPSATADGGAPTGSIDLSSLVQAADGDGTVDMSWGHYDSASQRLWVVLQNIDQTTFPLACRGTKATVIAIDTTKDKVVSLSDAAPGGGYTFTLTDPTDIAFDSANNRLVASAYGCQDELPVDAGPGVDGGDAPSGALLGAGIEALSLTDGTSTVLFTDSAIGTGGRGQALKLEGNGDAFAVLLDPNTYAATGYLLDLNTKTVKSTFPTIPDPYGLASDGAGHVYGLAAAADGGSNKDLVVLDVTSGTTTTLAASVITDPMATLGGVALW